MCLAPTMVVDYRAMATATVTVTSAALPDVVWDVLTRSADWDQWSDLTNSVRERDGQDHPDGVGSIRTAWGAGLVQIREEVITFDPERHVYAYKLLSGLPIRDYTSTVTLEATGNGTTITWVPEGRAPLPLPGADQVVGLGMKLAMARTAGALARQAERTVRAA